jgi:hypothetical protein
MTEIVLPKTSSIAAATAEVYFILHEQLHRGQYRPVLGSADNVRVRAEFGWQQSNVKWNISGFIGPFLFHKEKLFVVAPTLCLWQSRVPVESPTNFIFSEIFLTCPIAETLRDKTLRTWHPVSFHLSSNAEIMSYVVWESLNDPFQNYWHLCVKTQKWLMIR